MEPIKNQLQLTGEFVVRREDINDNGILTVCKILKEITSLYDQAVILAFGDLNFYSILNSSYHLEFKSPAYPGDVITLDSTAIISFGQSLEIYIIVSKRTKKDNTIAQGHFIFHLETKEEHSRAYLN